MAPLTICVIGAGFGGSYTIRELIRVKFLFKHKIKIIVFEPRDNFVFTPLLHEVATAGLAVESVRVPYELLFDNCVTHIKEHAQKISFTQKTVSSKTKKISYDYLVLSPGSKSNYFGNEKIAANTLPLKNDQDAINIRYAIEQAVLDAAKTKAKQEQLLTFSIVGGGPTGIELAGELRQFVKAQLKHHQITTPPTIRLIQAAPSLLPFASTWMQEQAKQKLEQLNVELLLDTKVTSVRKNAIITDRSYPSNVTIWVAGVTPNIVTCDLSKKECTRYFANKDLSLINYPTVFALGDAAGFEPKLNEQLPALAQAAVKEATTVARNIVLHANNKQTRLFAFHSKGFLLSIGQKFALAELDTPLGRLRFKGFFAWWLWRTIYLFKYLGAGMKIKTAAYWTLLLWRGRDLKELKPQR